MLLCANVSVMPHFHCMLRLSSTVTVLFLVFHWHLLSRSSKRATVKTVAGKHRYLIREIFSCKSWNNQSSYCLCSNVGLTNLCLFEQPHVSLPAAVSGSLSPCCEKQPYAGNQS